MNQLQIATLCSLLFMNIAGLVTAHLDKKRAIEKQWRIPEMRFLWLAALGGGAGVLAGFFLFRHKTKHAGLLAGVIALAVLCYAVIIALFLLL